MNNVSEIKAIKEVVEEDLALVGKTPAGLGKRPTRWSNWIGL